jgi:hypothetical protein
MNSIVAAHQHPLSGGRCLPTSLAYRYCGEAGNLLLQMLDSLFGGGHVGGWLEAIADTARVQARLPCPLPPDQELDR